MYFAASLLEGIVIARVSAHLPYSLIFSAVATDLLKKESQEVALAGNGGFEHVNAHNRSCGYEFANGRVDADYGERM